MSCVFTINLPNEIPESPELYALAKQEEFPPHMDGLIFFTFWYVFKFNEKGTN